MFVRLHLIEPAAAPAARLFAIRHAQGHLVRDGDGAVVIGTDAIEIDKRRRALNVATVASVVALVPEGDVREGEATSLVPDVLVGPLAAFLDVATVALARYVSPPTLDEMGEIAHGMGFELTPRPMTVPSLDEMRELLGRMRAEPDAPKADDVPDAERQFVPQTPEAATSIGEDEQAHQGQPEVAQAAPAPKPDAEPKTEKKRKPRA